MNTHKDMSNLEIANLLRQVSAIFEIKGDKLPGGGVRFRQRAYENAADSIENLSTPTKELWENKKLDDIPGVGSNLASHLEELFKTGKVSHFESMAKGIPEGMFELLNVSGIGPKTAYKLSKSLGLNKSHSALAKLKQAAKKGKIRQIEGFAEESEKQIIQSLEEQSTSKTNRILLSEAKIAVEPIIKHMMRSKAVISLDPLGSLRRQASTIGDIDLAVATKSPQDAIKHFVSYQNKKKVLAQGDNTARIVLTNNIQVDLKTQTPDKYGALLQHFTGSKAHNVALRELAIKKDMSLSEYGIKDAKTKKIKSFADEADFYKQLGLDWIDPELREDTGEIEAAQHHNLPNLVKPKDIKGDLHIHTKYDWISSHDQGSESMEEVVKAAQDLNYEYIGLSDHNPSVSSYSSQKIISLIQARKEKIEKLNYSISNQSSKRKIKVINSMEIDIQSNGNLAVTEKALEYLDMAIVSVHSSMRLNKNDMTKRVLAGLSHPKAKVLGHPSGRLLNKRLGYELDWDAIFDYCKKHHKLIEINATPKRLDLSDVLVKDAIKAGVMLIINTDSHSITQMPQINYGVAVARRGWAEPENIANTLPWEKFRDIIN